MSGAEVGARGSFHDQAHAHSPNLWLSQHRRLLVAAVAGIVELAIAAARR